MSKINKQVVKECTQATIDSRIFPALYIMDEYSREHKGYRPTVKMTSKKYSNKGYKSGQCRIRKVAVLDDMDQVREVCESISKIVFDYTGRFYSVTVHNEKHDEIFVINK